LVAVDVGFIRAQDAAMNADELRAYRNRWALVAEVERAELTKMTAAQKFADTAMLMRVARSLAGSSASEEDEGVLEVRRRWNLLAERMGV
jgi:hypothetical protein